MACNKKGPPEGGPSNCVLIAKYQDATLLVVVMVLVVSVVVIVLDMELSGVVVVVVSVVVLVSLVAAGLEQAAMLRAATAAPARASLRRTLEVMLGPLRRLERGVANLTTQTQHGNGREPAALLQYATPD